MDFSFANCSFVSQQQKGLYFITYLDQCQMIFVDDGDKGMSAEIYAAMVMTIMMMIMSIMSYQRGWDTCVPTPKMAYFSVLKAFLFLKYFKNNLGLTESSFNP